MIDKVREAYIELHRADAVAEAMQEQRTMIAALILAALASRPWASVALPPPAWANVPDAVRATDALLAELAKK